MNKSKIAQKANGNVVIPDDFDFEKLVPTEKLTVVPRPAAEDDFDFNELVVAPAAEVVAEPEPETAVTVKKPAGMLYIFVHPVWRVDVPLLMPEEGKQRKEYTHAVLPAVAKKYPQICRLARLVPYADKNGKLYLWPVLLENAAGFLSSWSASALSCIGQAVAAGKWSRYPTKSADGSKRDADGYEVFFAKKQQDPPQWPAGGVVDMVKMAFQGAVIRDVNDGLLEDRMGVPASVAANPAGKDKG